MSLNLKKITAEFYRASSGKEPVREWLKELLENDRKTIGKDIATVEYSWPIGMPLCRPMRGGLFEVRSNLAGNRISRVLFVNVRTRMVLLHGFIKKTQETTPRDLRLAEKRMKEVLDHER
ncbi:MAG: type II toxin-antitoxin system RelE/ParE family toxin [Pseudomonadota bacterium]